MQYGKIRAMGISSDGTVIYEQEGYHGGTLKDRRTWREESVAIANSSELLSEALVAMDLVLHELTDDVTITVKRNREGKLMLVKKWQVS